MLGGGGGVNFFNCRQTSSMYFLIQKYIKKFGSYNGSLTQSTRDSQKVRGQFV